MQTFAKNMEGNETRRRRIKASRSFNENDHHGTGAVGGGPSPSPGIRAPRRRMNRRASTGGYSPHNNPGYDSPSSQRPYDDDDHDHDSLFNRAMLRKALSKEESQNKLQQQLAQVSDYNYNPDRDDKLQQLKERFSPSKPSLKSPRRLQRRSSLSSCASQNSQADTRSGKDDMSVDVSIDLNHSKLSEGSFNMSSNTIPITNVVKTENISNDGYADGGANKKNSAKTDQIVESLVWFSFHTPRAVLEDLITHELDLWRLEEKREKARKKAIKKIKKKKKKKEDYKLTYTMRDDDSGSDDDDDDDDDEGSVSSLSDAEGVVDVFDGNFSESILKQQQMVNRGKIVKLPKSVKRECALLFVDMSGFTKLATILDVEAFAKVINSYFDMIVSEVLQFGGDLLKFAGDAFFAEWKIIDDEEDDDEGDGSHPLADLNASLASINDLTYDEDIPKIAMCVLAASKCAASIVKKFSDYQVMTSSNTSEAMLNVHCGVGCGNLVGLHLGDYKEDQHEEGGVELRREFLILGSPIDQVSKAADVATDGEVLASPEAIMALAFCCDITEEQRYSTEPVCIASRDEVFFEVILEFRDSTSPNGNAIVPAALQPYDSLRMHCKALNHAALARLHLQMALYVHPVIRGDELAMSAAILAGKISQPTEALESRHRAEAELRSVLTIFIKAVISPRITGLEEVDTELFHDLCNIMHVTSRELDRYSGHLRQFIVDDKGVVLIATFGLRGSTFPNMISNNGLPAICAIHRALKTELKVENRIGATFGKVYCGVVGGVRRHEFAVMGAPVNLAARLMASKVNRGILVDEAVREQADARYGFHSLPPVSAKGYDKPVPILEPIEIASGNKKKKWSSLPLVGRITEKEMIANVSSALLSNPDEAQITMVFLIGESGMGKSALAMSVVDDFKKKNAEEVEDEKSIISARSTSTETQQRIPLSSYRNVFQSVVRYYCEHEETLSSLADDGRSLTSASTTNISLHSMSTPMSTPRLSRFRGLANQMGHDDRPSLTRSPLRGVIESHQAESGDVVEKKDRVSQSMRDICHGFGSPGSVRQLLRKTEAGTKPMPHSTALSQSVHCQNYKPSLKRDNNLAHSLHRSRTPKVHKETLGSTLKRDTLSQSLHRSLSPTKTQKESLGQSLHRINMSRAVSIAGSAKRAHSSRSVASASVDGSTFQNKNTVSVPFFEKLCWVCEELDYPYEYADIVGSQFLGLDGASPVTHVDGHIPTMDELSEFLALAFICLTDYADLTVVVLDDFQWVDAFSWKIFQVLGKKATKLLLICAARSHDKQALRRLSTAASGQNQLQSRMIEISLGPFDFDEIRQLTSKVLGHDEHAINDSLCTDIFQRTGGLPVYVIQVLEDIKRKNSVTLDESGMLQWTAEGLKEKHALSSNKSGVVMQETFLSRFDTLDVRVRKVVQSCAVLGLSFSLSDVIQVHPEMEEMDIESALEAAVDEMILVEHIDDDDDTTSMKSGSAGNGETDSYAHTLTDGTRTIAERFFQFSHAMWRQNVLTTMLKERKMELHRLIAEAMERDEVLVLEQSDISRLLTLFDHWKSCGDFCKTAPLALAVGARLEEWDLCAQSLELYEDALEMSFDTVQRVEGDVDNNEWVQVAAKPAVLDYILRLHIRIGLCYQNLGDESESICMFEDAYNIIKTSSKVPRSSKSLMMPIISSLCVLKLDKVAPDKRTKLEQEKLAERFVKEAIENGNPVHVGRALAMEADHYSKLGNLDRAFESLEKLKSTYDLQANSFDMLAEYGRDFALECYCESVQWYYLQEQEDEASKQAEIIIHDFLPLLASVDADISMYAIWPLVQVLRLSGRARDAEVLLKSYIIQPYQENGSLADYWAPLFNPLAYLLEIIVMEENELEDPQVLEDIEAWVLDEENCEYSFELERKAHTIIGEICWRLLMTKDDDDPTRDILAAKTRALLSPIAYFPHPEIFLKRTAEALIEAL